MLSHNVRNICSPLCHISILHLSTQLLLPRDVGTMDRWRLTTWQLTADSNELKWCNWRAWVADGVVTSTSYTDWLSYVGISNKGWCNRKDCVYVLSKQNWTGEHSQQKMGGPPPIVCQGASKHFNLGCILEKQPCLWTLSWQIDFFAQSVCDWFLSVQYCGLNMVVAGSITQCTRHESCRYTRIKVISVYACVYIYI